MVATLAVGAGLVLAVAPPMVRMLGDVGEDYCELTRASFERTGKLARELATALENLDAEGTAPTASRLTDIGQALQQESTRLGSISHPPGAENVLVHGAATVSLLLALTDPHLAEVAQVDREEAAAHIRDHFLAARSEARAAAAALRQAEAGCSSRKAAQGSFQLLGR